MRLLLGLLLTMVVPQIMNRPQPGIWSADAAYLWPGPTVIADYPKDGRSIEVASPDKRLVLLIGESTLSVAPANHPGKHIGPDIPVEDLAEVLWAPDSKAFALTQSNGGWVGSWNVAVYLVNEDGIQRINIGDQAFAEFKARKVVRKKDCNIEAPNIGAVAWIDGSSRLIILAEAPPHSSCCDMGYVKGFLLEIPNGKILARYSRAELGRTFKNRLGGRFK
jgi:hypothetical protein